MTVVQLPDIELPAVTPSPFGSLKVLEAVMQFVAPEQLRAIAQRNGLSAISSATSSTPAGKRFQVEEFQAV